MPSQADLQCPAFLVYIGTTAGDKEIGNAVNGKCRHAGSLRTINQRDTATGTVTEPGMECSVVTVYIVAQLTQPDPPFTEQSGIRY